MRRKDVPCACDPCKGKNYVRAVNNVSPDPNGDLTIRGGAGIEIIQSGDDLVINNTANPNAFVAGNNIELNPSGDDISVDLVDEPVVDGLTVNGDLEVNGDIIQNGAAYETHAEKVYSRDDYIIMREGAISALPQGDYSGFQVKLYDGVNDGRLVIDNQGVARVGDVGDEQPLLTRDEAADLADGAVLKWDAANYKAVKESTVGDDTHPVKSVNGVLTPVSDALVKAVETQSVLNLIGGMSGQISVNKKNGICTITCYGASTSGSITDASITTESMPVPMGGYVRVPVTYGSTVIGNVYIYTAYNLQLHATITGAQSFIAFTLTYAIDE